MNFFGVRELSNNTKSVLSVVAEGKKVVITDNGKPAAIMLRITEENFESVLAAVQRMEAQSLLTAIQTQSAANFPDGLSDEEIQKEIDAARKGA